MFLKLIRYSEKTNKATIEYDAEAEVMLLELGFSTLLARGLDVMGAKSSKKKRVKKQVKAAPKSPRGEYGDCGCGHCTGDK